MNKVQRHSVLDFTLNDVAEIAHKLEDMFPSQTRGDLLRRVRAACELQGAKVPDRSVDEDSEP